MKLVKNIAIVVLISVISIGVTSCNKINDSLNVQTTSTDDLFELLKDAPQTFSGQAGGNWTIIGQKGTRVHFNPQSFKDAAGNYVTSGTIDIELIETPKAKDMLLNKTITMTGSNLLQSGGSIHIKATQNGQELVAGRYGIDFIQDAPSADDMSIFQGVTDQTTGFTSWFDGATNTQQGTRQDSIGSFFQFDSVNNFNWINCDRFYYDPGPKTNITININGATFLPNGVITFIIFPEINGVTNMYPFSTTDFSTVNLGGSYRAPVGIKAHFVTLGKEGNDYYYGSSTNQTINNAHTGSVTVSKMTAAQIEQAIKNLY